MPFNITKFEILGERCSGTNFLEETIVKNFNINFSNEHGSKHFFCHNDYNKENTNDTLFIGIIRNPVYWLNSFSKDLHHVPEVNRRSLKSFLFNEFYSIHNELKPDNPNRNKINVKDLNHLTGQKYKNIFELRNTKNNYLMNEMPSKVNNYILINYEDLLFNFRHIMKIIKEKFNLTQKLPFFEKGQKYKKSETHNFVKQRDISFTPQIVNMIWANLNVKQENKLGYFPFDNNNAFKSKYNKL